MQYRASHILVENESQIEKALAILRTGSSFADVARDMSRCPSSRNGGDLGMFPTGAMVPEFEKAVAESDINQVVGPVKTQFGYHLILRTA